VVVAVVLEFLPMMKVREALVVAVLVLEMLQRQPGMGQMD